MGGQVGAHKGTWAIGHTQLLERVCKGKLMEKSLEDCLEGATASGCGSGIDVGEQARQAGRRAKHRAEGSKDKLKFSDILHLTPTRKSRRQAGVPLQLCMYPPLNPFNHNDFQRVMATASLVSSNLHANFSPSQL